MSHCKPFPKHPVAVERWDSYPQYTAICIDARAAIADALHRHKELSVGMQQQFNYSDGYIRKPKEEVAAMTKPEGEGVDNTFICWGTEERLDLVNAVVQMKKQQEVLIPQCTVHVRLTLLQGPPEVGGIPLVDVRGSCNSKERITTFPEFSR
ncbi:hypothetical protein UY3_00599 [Chelonia mydas]|uniref:Uncharacterized protein n=1 Tax=Chelonia mydas TaxID=8469 RepID=M7BWJ1_CHEMY|nr:hypothetical protein UY3_00599 [Chelonia mydas]